VIVHPPFKAHEYFSHTPFNLLITCPSYSKCTTKHDSSLKMSTFVGFTFFKTASIIHNLITYRKENRKTTKTRKYPGLNIQHSHSSRTDLLINMLKLPHTNSQGRETSTTTTTTTITIITTMTATTTTTTTMVVVVVVVVVMMMMIIIIIIIIIFLTEWFSTKKNENKLQFVICKLSAYHVQKIHKGMWINKFG